MDPEPIQKYADHNLFQTPEIKPKIQLWRYQWVGIPLLLAIPILALLNVFGAEHKEIIYSNAGITIKTKYPKKIRLGQNEYFRLEMENQSDSSLEKIKVNFDPSYIKNFDDAVFTPQVEENYIVPLGQIDKNSRKYIDLKIRAGKSGNYKGKISFFIKDQIMYETQIETLVLP